MKSKARCMAMSRLHTVIHEVIHEVIHGYTRVIHMHVFYVCNMDISWFAIHTIRTKTTKIDENR